jgi:menaquinone-dependent protoporphyrinogen oxidase
MGERDRAQPAAAGLELFGRATLEATTMKPILVLYATRAGHTQRIAEYIARALSTRGAACEVMDVAEPLQTLDFAAYEAAILAASVHGGHHEREMIEFVKAHRHELERLKTVFLSASLSEAGAEDAARPGELRDKARSDVARMIEDFVAATGFRATITRPVAGALLYTQYNWLLRFVMRLISKREGGSTDTSRDHDYTDWAALDRFAGELIDAPRTTKGGKRQGSSDDRERGRWSGGRRERRTRIRAAVAVAKRCGTGRLRPDAGATERWLGVSRANRGAACQCMATSPAAPAVPARAFAQMAVASGLDRGVRAHERWPRW